MAVEERETFQGGRYIDLVLYEALHKHCVLYDAGRGLAIHARQFEAVAVEVDGMGIVGLVIEHQAVAPAFMQHTRVGLFIEGGAVDRPAIGSRRFLR